MTRSIPPLPIDRTHGGVDEVGNSAGLIDFSTNLNPLGPPPQAIEAYHQAVAELSLYPPPYPRRLEALIAEWLGIDPQFVLAGNGSTQLIHLLARVLKLRSPRVVIPTFSEIANALIAADSRPLPIATLAQKNFRLDPAEVVAALESGADGIFLGRPNSPTGNLLSFDEVLAVATACHRHGAWCIFDEAFIEFAADTHSVIALCADFPKLIVLRSLTKIFAIPGLRLGYLVTHPNNTQMFRDAIEPWSVNVAAAAVASACLRSSERFIEATLDLVANERRWIEDELGAMPRFRLFPAAANFIMLEVLGENAPGDFARHTRQHGIVIRDLQALPGCGPGFYRIGIRTRPDNEKLVAAASAYQI